MCSFALWRQQYVQRLARRAISAYAEPTVKKSADFKDVRRQIEAIRESIRKCMNGE